MIVRISGYRLKDFPDAPYGDAETKYKTDLANKLREKWGLKDTDAILITII